MASVLEAALAILQKLRQPILIEAKARNSVVAFSLPFEFMWLLHPIRVSERGGSLISMSHAIIGAFVMTFVISLLGGIVIWGSCLQWQGFNDGVQRYKQGRPGPRISALLAQPAMPRSLQSLWRASPSLVHRLRSMANPTSYRVIHLRPLSDKARSTPEQCLGRAPTLVSRAAAACLEHAENGLLLPYAALIGGAYDGKHEEAEYCSRSCNLPARLDVPATGERSSPADSQPITFGQGVPGAVGLDRKNADAGAAVMDRDIRRPRSNRGSYGWALGPRDADG
jgi:hypothetical protein